MSEHATDGAAEANAAQTPTPQIIGYARRLLARRYGISAQEADDLVGQALLDFVAAARSGRPCGDGLFLVIAHRRACDFWRKRRSEVSLGVAATVAVYELNDSSLDEHTLRRRLQRCVLSSSLVKRRRVLDLVDEILGGATFEEACRAVGLPRGSRERYRQTLRHLLASALEPNRLTMTRIRSRILG